jgi:acetyltransferase-like isoleucine patch superfamily enzyme
VWFGKSILIWAPGGVLEIGDQTSFMDRCMILVSPNPLGTLRIGERCYFANDVNICAYGKILIGNNVRVAEFTSVRDASHAYQNSHLRIDQQGDVIGTISIGDDVWIGQGCLLLAEGKSLTIGKGAVIGAHSVVKDSIPDYAVAVGAPARVVRYRSETGEPTSKPNQTSGVNE